MPPMVGTDVFGRDAFGLDLVGGEQHGFDFRPAGKAQQTDAAGCHEWYGGEMLALARRLQNVDPAFDRP